MRDSLKQEASRVKEDKIQIRGDHPYELEMGCMADLISRQDAYIDHLVKLLDEVANTVKICLSCLDLSGDEELKAQVKEVLELQSKG